MGNKKKRSKRGYPVGLLISFQPMQATFWKLFSERTVQLKVVKLGRKFKNAEKTHLYQYFEEIVNKLRPILKEGLKSVLLVTPPKKHYAQAFLTHVKAHQRWLVDEKHQNSASFQELTGIINNIEGVTFFIQSEEYLEAVGMATENEGNQIIENLEKRLNDIEEGLVLYTLKEIEKLVFAGGKRKKKFKPMKLIPEYIILTTDYLESHTQKNRLQKLLQIAENRKIKSKIVDIESSAGIRVKQLGGLVCFLQMNSNYEKELGQSMIDQNKGK
jgi:stalled ribosome rescue protein Dom34